MFFFLKIFPGESKGRKKNEKVEETGESAGVKGKHQISYVAVESLDYMRKSSFDIKSVLKSKVRYTVSLQLEKNVEAGKFQ